MEIITESKQGGPSLRSTPLNMKRFGGKSPQNNNDIQDNLKQNSSVYQQNKIGDQTFNTRRHRMDLNNEQSSSIIKTPEN